MIFYFSGTGNSRWVAQQLAAQLQESLVAMADDASLIKRYELKADERVVFVFPVYAWAPPTLVLEFIARVNLPDAVSVSFVCTCGDDIGKTADVFCQAIRKRGWICLAGYSVTMPNTYVSLPGFDVDDKEVEHRKVQNAKARVQFIAEQLSEGVHLSTPNCHEGAFPRLKTYGIGPLFRTFLMSPKPFHATDRCTGCHICEKKCPVQNITVTDRPQWGDRCTQCLACYHACPFHAIEYGKRTQEKGQYKGEFLK